MSYRSAVADQSLCIFHFLRQEEEASLWKEHIWVNLISCCYCFPPSVKINTNRPLAHICHTGVNEKCCFSWVKQRTPPRSTPFANVSMKNTPTSCPKRVYRMQGSAQLGPHWGAISLCEMINFAHPGHPQKQQLFIHKGTLSATKQEPATEWTAAARTARQ